jgi:hypothetical protein
MSGIDAASRNPPGSSNEAFASSRHSQNDPKPDIETDGNPMAGLSVAKLSFEPPALL